MSQIFTAFSIFLFFARLPISATFHFPSSSSSPKVSTPKRSVEEQALFHNHVDRHSFLTSSAVIATSLLTKPDMSQAEYLPTIDNTSSQAIASFALRRAGSVPPSLTNLPPNKNGIFVRFGEQMLYSDDGSRTPGKDVFCSFDFPADWLQLDRIFGGIQYVDQRNGDKLYLLKMKMPDGVNLKDVPKAYLGNAIFDPRGELVRTGNIIEDYKVTSARMLSEVDENGNTIGYSRRRFTVKYTTLTGNNFSVERKGLVDAFEVEGMVYMLMTGSNAVLFDKKGRERDTVEYIADSFQVQPVYAVKI